MELNAFLIFNFTKKKGKNKKDSRDFLLSHKEPTHKENQKKHFHSHFDSDCDLD